MNESGIVKLPKHKETKTELAMWRFRKKSATHSNKFCMKFILVSCIIVADVDSKFELRRVQTILSCSTAAGTAMGKIVHKVSRQNKL
jgi:hypothetical protein